MNKLIFTLLITLFLLASAPALWAFESTLTLQGGVNIPVDDIDGEDEWMGAWGLSWDAWMTKSLALGFNPYFTNLKVWDGSDYYGSSIEGIDVYLKLRPDKYIALNFGYDSVIHRIAPFIAVGGGYAAHGSKGVIGGTQDTDNEYMAVFPHAAAGISFLTKWNTTFDLGVKYDYTMSDRLDLLEDGDTKDGYIMPYIGLGIHFGSRKLPPTPVVLVTGYMERFSTQKGKPSAAQSYNISGTDLKGRMYVTAPEGFELSIDGGNSWLKSASLDPNADRPVMIRMTGRESGDFSGNIVNASEGAANVNIPVSGTVEEPVPPARISISGNLGGFETEMGTPSAAQSYVIRGENLTGRILVKVPRGFEISSDGGKTWISTASLDQDFDGPVWIRMNGTRMGVFEGLITHSSDGARDITIPVSGMVGEPTDTPRINISGNLGGFETGMGTPSEAQSFNISGFNLTDRILVKAPRGFEISTDGGESWIATASLDPDFDGPVWIRMNGTRMGTFEGLVIHSSVGADEISIPVSGVVGEPTDIPKINISGELEGFDTEMGTPSEPQSYNLSGANLTGWTVVTAPTGYELSINGGKTWVTSANLEPGFSGPIWVRMTGYRVGAFQGFVVHTSEGAANVNIPVSGNVAEPPEVTELKEDMYTYVVHFPTNEYRIPEADKPFLDRVVESMQKFPGIRIQIQGHTDSTGGDKINIPLSLNRAKFVRQYLVDKGIDESRIDVKGFSSDRPIATNKTAEGRAANRRADMIVLD
jgi:outer membrane protein OmpA-like peptidoglycan-associated protein